MSNSERPRPDTGNHHDDGRPPSEVPAESETAKPAPTRPALADSEAAGFRSVAPAWHTVVLMAVLLFIGIVGARSHHTFTTRHGRTLLYGTTIAWEWLMVAFIAWGIRGRIRFRELLRRPSAENPLARATRDIAWGIAAWIGITVVLSMTATALGMAHGNQMAEIRQKLGFLVPRDATELRWFLALSATAAFCEETIFRGYLQRQMSAWTGNATAGVLFQAIIFGVGHAYEGRDRMLLILLYGALLGIVACARRSLRPGMLAHFLQDAITGVVLYRLLR